MDSTDVVETSHEVIIRILVAVALVLALAYAYRPRRGVHSQLERTQLQASQPAGIPPSKQEHPSFQPREATEPSSSSAVAVRDAPCFRISGIPSRWDRNILELKLKSIDPDLDKIATSILFSGPFPDCDEPTQSQVALLMLGRCTPYFGSIDRGKRRLEVIYENDHQGEDVHFKILLFIDRDFHDLTPLNRPSTPIVADVVAVTGLGGHAFGSWRSRAETQAIDRPMWLRDFLAARLPNVRIMTYGYDSILRGGNVTNLTDYRRNFKECLQNARRYCPNRDLVFIGHSMGGILVIQTLIESRQNPQYGNIFDSIKGLFLFGTPHQGLTVDDLREMVDDDNLEVKGLLEQLQEGSEFLENQREAFAEVWSSFHGEVVTFYETQKTKQVKKGNFKREGQAVQLVKRMSAQLNLPGEHRLPISSNHSDMVKFDSPQDRTFQTVVRHLSKITDCPSNRNMIEFFLPMTSIVLDEYAVDQNNHFDKLVEMKELDRDGKYFWIFRNMDYVNWSSTFSEHQLQHGRSKPITTLVLSGSPTLEHVAPHITKTMQNSGSPSGVLLYYFFGPESLRPSIHTNADSPSCSASVVCTMLKQFLELHPPADQASLQKEFLAEFLGHISDKQPQRIPVDSETPLRLLFASSPSALFWAALERTLIVGLDKWNSSSEAMSPNERHITFVLDLEQQPVQEINSLMEALRKMKNALRQYNWPARILITFRSTTGNLALQGPAEVHIEYNKERQDCLRSLRFRNTRYEKISKPHARTFGWFQECPQYQKWQAAEGSSLFLVEGKPGSGKSTLMRFFYDSLCQSDSYDIIAKFFYSHRDGESEMSHDNMLQCLLYDILSSDESFFIHFQAAFRDLEASKPLHSPQASWSRSALEKILRDCTNHPLERKLCLVVDALDESDDRDRADIIEFLWSLSDPLRKGCVVKVFLASRPISEHHEGLIQRGQRILLQERNREDIQKCLQDLLQDPSFDRNPGIKQRIIDYITVNAGGVFLWVYLVGTELDRFARKGATPREMFDFLRSLPKGLEKYYERMLGELSGCTEGEMYDGRKILQFCLFSHRAMKLMELRHALAIPSEPEDPEPDPTCWQDNMHMDITRRLLYCVGNYLEIKSDPDSVSEDPSATIQVIHQTVREFFLKPHPAVQKSRFAVVADRESARRMIQSTSIRYMNLHYEEVQRTFRSSSDSWNPEDTGAFVKYLDTRPFIKYSLEYLKLCHSGDESHPPAYQSHPVPIIRAQSYPHAPAYSLLKQLPGPSVEASYTQKHLNDLLLLAARQDCAIAVGNLLAAGAEVEAKDWYGWTPLQLTAAYGTKAIAHMLIIDGKAEIETKDWDGWTALHLAAAYGNEAVVRTLIVDGKADTEAKNRDGLTPLQVAIKHGKETAARVLVIDGKVDIGAKDEEDGLTALHRAVMHGKEAVARVLVIDGKADVETKDRNGWTALHLAAKLGKEAVARMLIVDGKANIDARGGDGWTALHFTAAYGKEAAARVLIVDGKADVEAKDNYEWTPLHIASAHGEKAVAQVLIVDGKADVEAKTRYGWTALHHAATYGKKAVARILIIDGKADVEAQDEMGWMPLHYAAVYGTKAVTRVLLVDGKADVEAKNRYGRTALHLAAKNGKDAVARVLIVDGKADVEAKDLGGWTALHHAAADGEKAVARVLIFDGKADIEAETGDGRTALQLAVEHGREAVACVLTAIAEVVHNDAAKLPPSTTP